MRDEVNVKTLYEPVPFSTMMDGTTEIEWLMEGIIPRTTTGIAAGEPGVGKTWLVMDLVLAMASGVPWLGKFETKPCKVLVVDEENAHVLVRKRFLSLAWKYRQYERLDEIDFLVGESIDITPLEHPKIGMQPSGDFTMLYNTIGTHGYDVVVFDSLTRLHHADENDSSRMSAVFRYIKKLMDDFGVSCVFTHHFNKSRGHSNNRLRGSSDILAFPDYVLRVETDRNHGDISDTGIVVDHGKSRWGINMGKFFVKLQDAQDSNDKEIMMISTDDLREAILEYLMIARNKHAIINEMENKGLAIQRIDSLLNEMIKERVIYKPSGGMYQTTGSADFDDLGDLL